MNKRGENEDLGSFFLGGLHNHNVIFSVSSQKKKKKKCLGFMAPDGPLRVCMFCLSSPHIIVCALAAAVLVQPRLSRDPSIHVRRRSPLMTSRRTALDPIQFNYMSTYPACVNIKGKTKNKPK
jgi:hypothetical protein